MPSAKSLFVTIPVCATALAAIHLVAQAGEITPPGAPAPTFKTLDEVEARTPVGPDTTPGDLDSVYRIAQPGSYYLTGPLLAEPGKRGIEIAANYVTLDLNGFTLFGAGGTTGIALGSSDEGGSAFPQDGVVIRNGFIQGWSADGIQAAFNLGLIERVTIDGCGGSGIDVPAIVGLSIEDCTVTRCGAAGISNEGVATTIARTRIIGNGGDGVESLGEGLDISDCMIAQNGMRGVDLAAETRIRDAYITDHESGACVLSDAPLQLSDSMITRSGDPGNQIFHPAVEIGTQSAMWSNHIRPSSGVGVNVTGEYNWIDRNAIFSGNARSVINPAVNGQFSTFVTRNHLQTTPYTIGFSPAPGVGELLAPIEVETNDRPHSNYNGTTPEDPQGR